MSDGWLIDRFKGFGRLRKVANVRAESEFVHVLVVNNTALCGMELSKFAGASFLGRVCQGIVAILAVSPNRLPRRGNCSYTRMWLQFVFLIWLRSFMEVTKMVLIFAVAWTYTGS